MRCVSTESVAFVQSPGEATLRSAISSHAATVALCKQGRGVDRHLLGLRHMIEVGEPLPALFADTGYATLSRSVPLDQHGRTARQAPSSACFGPVVDEGFGISYAIHDDSVLCVVTNFHGLAGAFATHLKQASPRCSPPCATNHRWRPPGGRRSGPGCTGLRSASAAVETRYLHRRGSRRVPKPSNKHRQRGAAPARDIRTWVGEVRVAGVAGRPELAECLRRVTVE